MSKITILSLILFLMFLLTTGSYGQSQAALSSLISLSTMVPAFNDSGWQMIYQENFDSSYEAQDGQSFGEDDWLVYQLINGGAIAVANGYAQLNAPDFWNAALIRSTDYLPEEYKVRTKIGYVNYDLTNYEQEDYDNPDFDDHGGYYENGIYFLTLTDGACVGNQCAEGWWHYHRKMVIDVDNHVNSDGHSITFHPVFMVYMAPETNSGGNLLRTWTGTYWDTSPWNWNVAYTYDYDSWYYAELEKRDGHIILRLYDVDQNILQETTPVDLSLVNAMDDSVEYLYLGEPHTDDYEGDARIDEITLLIPENGGGIYEYLPGDANMAAGIWPPAVIGSDVTYLVNYFRGMPTNPSCLLDGFYCAADVNASCNVIGSDVTRLVSYFRGQAIIEYCPDYEPAWLSPGDCPAEPPSGWPNCE